jgi:hypothetical protein
MAALPHELAAFFLSSDDVTIGHLCLVCDMPHGAGTKNHLIFGLAQFGYDEQAARALIQERTAKRIIIRKYDDPRVEVGPRPDFKNPAAKACRCGVKTTRKNEADIFECEFCALPQDRATLFDEKFL